MNRDISRRDWLKGSSAVAIAMIAGSRANAQDMTVPGFIPSKDTPLRLSSNENPYGVSKTAREAIMEALEHSHLYSSRREGEKKLAALLAEIEGVGIKNITFSGGSGEILKTLGLITAMEGGSVLTADPTYHGLTR